MAIERHASLFPFIFFERIRPQAAYSRAIALSTMWYERKLAYLTETHHPDDEPKA
jgi:hypothetical protein